MNPGGDCPGASGIASGGYNIDGDKTCGLAAAGDLLGVDPKLGTLANNGGATFTHALQAGSLLLTLIARLPSSARAISVTLRLEFRTVAFSQSHDKVRIVRVAGQELSS
jgi:hypothetical protein